MIFKKIFYVYKCFACMYVYVTVCAWYTQRSKGIKIPLELKLQMVVGCHVGAGN